MKDKSTDETIIDVPAVRVTIALAIAALASLGVLALTAYLMTQ